MEASLIESLEGALEHYRQATTGVVDGQTREDYLRLIAITEKLADSLREGVVADVKIYALGFSRQVSDSFSPQPPEFRSLAQLIAEIKKRFV